MSHVICKETHNGLHVLSKDGKHLLGIIKYHTAWKKHCFFPRIKQLVLDSDALRAIASFCDTSDRYYNIR